MQRANDVTSRPIGAALPRCAKGMTQNELADNIAAAFQALGFTGDASVQFGKWTALPHGSITPQTLQEGDVV